jgi:hypothetical protein
MGLPADQLRGIAACYRLSQLVYACASLGVADALAEGPQTAEQVAGKIGAPAATVFRLLRAAASEGVIEARTGRYELNAFSRQLVSGAEESLREFILGWSALRVGYLAFGYLDQAVRAGASGTELAFGQRFHDYLRSHPGEAKHYEAAMESTVAGFRAAAAAYDFSRFGKIVDVGGGQGAFLVAIRQRCPHVEAVLFDVPGVVAKAPARLAPYPEGRDITIVGGDMFSGVPPGADAYLFSTVLRCFGDDECVRVLQLCREAMRPDGRVLAVEMVIPEGIPPSPQGLADLQALVVYGGKDRTKAEWAALMAAAGFGRPQFHPADDPYCVVEAAAG